MTTICYKDGILAADTAVSTNEHIVGTTSKIFRIEADIFGVSGSLADITKLKKWEGIDSLEKMGLSDQSCIYWIDEFGILREIEGDTVLPEIEAPFYACGTGGNFALGAMAHGASAAQAVKIAATHDLATNDDVQALNCGKKVLSVW